MRCAVCNKRLTDFELSLCNDDCISCRREVRKALLELDELGFVAEIDREFIMENLESGTKQVYDLDYYDNLDYFDEGENK